jgi:60 kDa SS-A/Ro ribonucleoprotein
MKGGETMANRKIFKSARPADVTQNLAGGVAYAMSEKAALTQYVMTGTFSNTFYADAEEDTDRILGLARTRAGVSGEARRPARERGYMKDAPARRVAMLAARSPKPREGNDG